MLKQKIRVLKIVKIVVKHVSKSKRTNSAGWKALPAPEKVVEEKRPKEKFRVHREVWILGPNVVFVCFWLKFRSKSNNVAWKFENLPNFIFLVDVLNLF